MLMEEEKKKGEEAIVKFAYVESENKKLRDK